MTGPHQVQVDSASIRAELAEQFVFQQYRCCLKVQLLALSLHVVDLPPELAEQTGVLAVWCVVFREGDDFAFDWFTNKQEAKAEFDLWSQDTKALASYTRERITATCPACGGEPVEVNEKDACHESRCANGHIWHKCPRHGIVLGSPMPTPVMSVCTCLKDPTGKVVEGVYG